MSNTARAAVVAIFILIPTLIVGGIVWVVGGTWSKTDASSMTCVYNGGPLDDQGFRGYTEPGTGRQYQGWLSETVSVPIGVRQYRISLTPGSGDTPEPSSVNVRVKGYDMTFEPTVTFTINTAIRNGKPVACDFIEKQLRQFGSSNFDGDGGWKNFLNERLRPILDDSMTRVLQADFDPGAVKFNVNNERDRAADEIGSELQRALARQLGDNYLCAPTGTFGSEECGTLTVIIPEPSLSADDEAQLAKPQRARIDADNDIAAADEAARKAQQVAEAKAIEAESAKTLADANETIAAENARVIEQTVDNDYAWCDYLVQRGQRCDLVKAAENGNYPSVILADGGQVAVAVPTPEVEQ